MKVDYERERLEHGPTQVIDPTEIKPGKVFRQRYWDGVMPLSITVASFPYEDNGILWVQVRLDGCPVPVERSLADEGVVPYGDGRWNQGNWLEDLEKLN